MKILILNTSESTGGAAVAANRLMKALNKTGHRVNMLVRDKQSDNPDVITVNTSWLKQKINKARFVWERWLIFRSNGFSKKNLFTVSLANTGNNISKHPLAKEADIIHLHWINQGFLSLKNIKQLLKLGKPIVWTMHDMWPCTGICHHAGNCEKFRQQCGNCPLLRHPKKNDWSYRIWKRKKIVEPRKIHFTAVSRWLQARALQSDLLEHSEIPVIANVIDTAIFTPGDKLSARKALNLPFDKKIILMGAAKLNDPVKGFNYLQDALRILTAEGTAGNYLLVLFGNVKNDPEFLSGLTVESRYLGPINNMQKLVKLYQAADVTVVPSLYETFGQTIAEAMSCGCLAVSFNNSGQTDIIDHLENGYLAAGQSAADLAKGLRWILHEADYASLSVKAVEKVRSHFAEWIIVGEYIDLYKKMLDEVVEKRN